MKINQDMNHAVIEYMNGIEAIKMFNQGEQSYQKYSNAVYNNVSLYYNWMKEFMPGVSMYKKLFPMPLLTIHPFGIYFYIMGCVSLVNLFTIIVLFFGAIESILSAMNSVDALARIGTITHEIEQILVLNNGKIEQRGTHEELIKNGRVYKTLIEMRNQATHWRVGN